MCSKWVGLYEDSVEDTDPGGSGDFWPAGSRKPKPSNFLIFLVSGLRSDPRPFFLAEPDPRRKFWVLTYDEDPYYYVLLRKVFLKRLLLVSILRKLYIVFL